MTTIINETTLNALKPGDLNSLAEMEADPCVSILMQTHRNGRETQQGPIRLKNLLKGAREKLKESGHDDGILAPLTALTNQNDFWQHQGDGLAIFLSSGDCRMFRLNRSVDEMATVGNAFFIQPLIREQNATGNYFVLSLSWDEAKLFRSDGESLSLVDTPALPAKFDDLISPSDPEESLQNTSHRSVGNTAGTSTAMFHGQGEGEDKIQADREHYLSLVGDEVATTVYNTGMPLVVVATSEVIGHFEAANKVTVDAKVDGSPAEWTDDELREHAHEAIKSHLKSVHSEFDERFGTAMAQSQASYDFADVLVAAKEGRIDALMVCHDEDHCEQTNRAVIDTLRSGGDVYQCRPESMPGNDAVVAAIFRY